MFKILYILIFCTVFTNFSFSKNSTTSKQYYFAVGIFMSANSQILTYGLITVQGGRLLGVQILRKQRFMYYIMGNWPTPANPKRVNLLQQHNVDSCFLIKDYTNKISGYYAKPFKYLWKIRYKKHPILYDDSGWSQEYYKPSPAQARFLKKHYGVSNVKTEYFYGESLYKLLRDIQTNDWPTLYQTLQDTL